MFNRSNVIPFPAIPESQPEPISLRRAIAYGAAANLLFWSGAWFLGGVVVRVMF